ncbi:MAG: hypothetical protein JNJ64_06140, partial [Flavobacteriales bacterium]|nr:hypothetical protein [Flavobacteriales bacterium]
TDPTEAWNGTARNSGGALVTGVYPYLLRVRSLYSTESREYRGSVNLLK